MTQDGEQPEAAADAEGRAENAAIDALLRSAVRAARAPEQVTLSNGIMLRLKPVPPGVLRRVVQAVKAPDVPVVFVESRGREEENPNDPGYLAALEECRRARLLADQKARFALGTEVIDVPDSMFGPEDDRWIEQLRAVGIEPRVDTPTTRYAEWLELYAVSRAFDVTTLVAACYATSAIFEPEVLDALNSFRSDT